MVCGTGERLSCGCISRSPQEALKKPEKVSDQCSPVQLSKVNIHIRKNVAKNVEHYSYMSVVFMAFSMHVLLHEL
jgi:hypothetical protein